MNKRVPKNPDELARRFEQLRADYVFQLPQRLAQIREIWLALKQGPWDGASFRRMHLELHNLAGSAGTFELMPLGSMTRELEMMLVETVSPDDDRLLA